MKRIGILLALLLVGTSLFAGEVYRLKWLQSPSTFLETQKVYAIVNGGTETQVGTDLMANVDSVDYEFTTNAVVQWRVVSIGDNGSTASSVTVTFTAANQAGILPATNLQQVFVRHND